MSNMASTIKQLFRGTPAPLHHRPEVMSAIDRHEVDHLVVYQDHIEGDEVANKVHHGGIHRVLHHYPAEHLTYWATVYPYTEFTPGSMGENLSATGLTEKNVCIGDVFEIGELLCLVTEPRKPCGTICEQYAIKGLARKVQNESRTGWFYRILKPGTIRPGDKIKLKERPHPELTVDACIQALLVRPDMTVLELMVLNPTLSENWKRPAAAYLETGVLPDDRPRLGEL